MRVVAQGQKKKGKKKEAAAAEAKDPKETDNAPESAQACAEGGEREAASNHTEADDVVPASAGNEEVEKEPHTNGIKCESPEAAEPPRVESGRGEEAGGEEAGGEEASGDGNVLLTQLFGGAPVESSEPGPSDAVTHTPADSAEGTAAARPEAPGTPEARPSSWMDSQGDVVAPSALDESLAESVDTSRHEEEPAGMPIARSCHDEHTIPQQAPLSIGSALDQSVEDVKEPELADTSRHEEEPAGMPIARSCHDEYTTPNRPLY